MKISIGIFTESRSLQFEASALLQGPLQGLRRQLPEIHVAEALHCIVQGGLLAGRTVLAAEILLDGRQHGVPAAACSIEPSRAVGAFVGELYERIAAATFQPTGSIYVGTARELAANGTAVFNCDLYLGQPMDPEFYPYRAFDDAAPYLWLQAEDLETCEPVWVPAGLVVPGAVANGPLCELTSIGVAAGRTLEAATEHAVAELHERSVLRRAWLYGAAFPPVGIADGGDDGSCPDWTVQAGGIWSGRRFCALVLSRHVSRPLYALGSGCSLVPVAALGHALEEAIQGRLVAWLHRHDHHPGREMTSFLDHQLRYCSAVGVQEITGLFEPATRIPPPPGETPWAAVQQNHVATKGIRLTLREFEDHVVVRVLEQGLQPMEARHSAARIVGHPGIQPRRTAPHPFG